MRNRAAFRLSGLLGSLALLLASADDAWANGFPHLAVAIAGDTAPETAGGTYASFGTEPSINASGAVAFFAAVTGGSTSGGIFVDSGGADFAVALEGDTAPGTGGGSYSAFSSFAINASGNVVFRAAVTGGTVTHGIFLDSGGIHTPVALEGDAAPGAGVYVNLLRVSMNDSGDVAFTSLISGGMVSSGIFMNSGGTDSVVTLEGDTAPGTGGEYSTFFSSVPAISAAGDVAFDSVAVVEGVFPGGVFLDAGATDTAVALPDDPAPGTGGGIYSTLFSDPGVNAFGEVAFHASVTEGSVIRGVFVDSGGTDRVVAVNGESAPGTGGGTYLTFFFGNPSISDAGDVEFHARVSGGPDGIFVDSAGTDVAVALEGDPAPGTGGGTYADFEPGEASISPARDFVFYAVLAGGTASEGIFKAVRPVAAPALDGRVLGAAGLTLAIAGALLAGLRSPRASPVNDAMTSD